jgi:hypothetical protein
LSEPDIPEQRRQAVVEYIMNHPQGREFIWGLLGDCGLYRSSWHPSELIHFNEGRRDVGLRVLDEIMRRCPMAYLDMQREAIERASQPESDEDDERSD